MWTEFEEGGYSFYYPGTGDEVSLTGCVYSGSVTLPAEILHDGVKYKITSVSGFGDNTALSSVVIPNGVILIADNAFAGCTNLSSVSLPSASLGEIGSSAFKNCTKLTSISLPSSLTTIGSEAFAGTGLTTISIPNSVTEMNSTAFSGCANLASVTIGSGLTKIESGMFQNCCKIQNLVIPSNITSIESSALSGCSGLVSLTIPESVEAFGAYVFVDCTGKLTINCNIPNPPSYDMGVFHGSQFTEIVIGNQVKYIGWNAIGRDANSTLTSLTIGNNVETIGNGAFHDCTGLTTVIIPNSVKTMGSGIFRGCI